MWGEHDDRFKALNSQLLKECSQLDWTTADNAHTFAPAVAADSADDWEDGDDAMAASAASSGKTLRQLAAESAPYQSGRLAAAESASQPADDRSVAEVTTDVDSIAGINHRHASTELAEAAARSLGADLGEAAQQCDDESAGNEKSLTLAAEQPFLEGVTHQQKSGAMDSSSSRQKDESALTSSLSMRLDQSHQASTTAAPYQEETGMADAHNNGSRYHADAPISHDVEMAMEGGTQSQAAAEQDTMQRRLFPAGSSTCSPIIHHGLHSQHGNAQLATESEADDSAPRQDAAPGVIGGDESAVRFQQAQQAVGLLLAAAGPQHGPIALHTLATIIQVGSVSYTLDIEAAYVDVKNTSSESVRAPSACQPHQHEPAKCVMHPTVVCIHHGELPLTTSSLSHSKNLFCRSIL